MAIRSKIAPWFDSLQFHSHIELRAGVVDHPSEWPYSGYHEIQSPRRKCAVIAYNKLAEKTGFQSYERGLMVSSTWQGLR